MTNGSNAEQVRELAGVIERKARESVERQEKNSDPYGNFDEEATRIQEAYRQHYLIQAVLLVAEQLAGVRDAVLAVEQALYEESEEEPPL